ncbi:MAG: ABC transporter transmembrane domain-containing protein, partial [Planctomycetaceae bacterium]
MNHLFRKSWKRDALRGEGWRAISEDAKNKAAGSAYLTSADQTSNWALIGRMLGLGWRYRFSCATVVFLHVLLVAMNVGGLGLTGLGIDFVRNKIDPSVPAPKFPFGLALPEAWSATQQLALIAGLILVTALVNTLMRYIAALAVADLSQRILVQLRSDVYDKLQRLSFRFFDHNQSSSIINRAAGDVGAVRVFVDGVIIKVLTVVLSLAVYIGYMLSMHVTL